ncbi:hypothetical protein UFOVP532_15 [uncultured Caudovirales phage]|uniref:Uncharacterized protein n=1 Tax=uncultured Caudovirales phage TaxID=2100421 RepID=A0A6J5MRV1_9CAUD|nr:hypothetical protein UFOVP532_15 [uncultured Caudovirales phage]
MLNSTETLNTLQAFNKYVIQQARTNLTKGDKNVSKKLYDSLKATTKVNPNSIENYIEMEQYGQFLDLGVKGKVSSAKAPNSPFKYGSGTGKKGGLTEGIRGWVKARRFQFKNRDTGKFMSYEQTAQLITRSIYLKGTKPTLFFSKPFAKGFESLPEELIKAYGLDIESFMKFTLKE